MSTFAFSVVTLLPTLLFAPPVPSKTSAPAKLHPVQVTFMLRWVRQEAETSPTAAPVPILMVSPTLSTVDGQVASLETKTSDTLFFVSLSPTVESSDNGGNSGKQEAARTFWSVRYAAKGLPGGVSSMALTGVTRLLFSDSSEKVIARLSLADPKTGILTEYRLEGHAVIGADGLGTGAPNTP